MDKQGTIEQMLELIYTLKLKGLQGPGLEALYELKDICEKLLSIHASQKRAPGYRLNGDKAPLHLVANNQDDGT